ncbi:hypothetical protein [Alterisphingorhabdus coralli]|uniref:Uncharacterized protein n=1 Tax=Alterisphingorhabdus coralli TaxID=3071408 RepID=A0AA97F951_9SPHN|nr:hypothetical protein [Parasphingorhabdus sp. SCSIO 66989]WOE76186.1 hypothetical protein RB602_05595 [Parasphingorhabdus sp. SCSIO 66989]
MRSLCALTAFLLLCQSPTALSAQQAESEAESNNTAAQCRFNTKITFYTVNDFDDSKVNKQAVTTAIRAALVEACGEQDVIEPEFLQDYDSFSVVTGSEPGRTVVWPCDEFNSDDKKCYNLIPENSFVFELSPSNGYSPSSDDLLFALRCGFAPETVEEEDETACLVD